MGRVWLDSTTICGHPGPRGGAVINNAGASYTFADETAITGVECLYWIEDMDLAGMSTNHAAIRAIPNPHQQQPGVILKTPGYGSTLSGTSPVHLEPSLLPRATTRDALDNKPAVDETQNPRR